MAAAETQAVPVPTRRRKHVTGRKAHAALQRFVQKGAAVTGLWQFDPEDKSARRVAHPGSGRDLAAWLAKWSGKYSRLTGWVEENIDETLTFYRLPRQRHKHLMSTNMLERLNEEIRCRTHLVRIFPNGESCLRLVRALAVETHENWLELHRYLNMDDLREHKKEALRRAA